MSPGRRRPWEADALDVEGHAAIGHRGGWDDDDWDIDGDDILTGVLILGGLAAIAPSPTAASTGSQLSASTRALPDPETPATRPGARRRYRSGGMAEAVDICVAEVEAGRGAVGSVDRASRSGEGWYVAGELDGGTPYSCWIDGAGRVTDIEAGDYGASYEAPAEDDASYCTVQKQAVDAGGDDGRTSWRRRTNRTPILPRFRFAETGRIYSGSRE